MQTEDLHMGEQERMIFNGHLKDSLEPAPGSCALYLVQGTAAHGPCSSFWRYPASASYAEERGIPHSDGEGLWQEAEGP